MTALCYAARNGQIPEAKMLLARGASVNPVVLFVGQTNAGQPTVLCRVAVERRHSGAVVAAWCGHGQGNAMFERGLGQKNVHNY